MTQSATPQDSSMGVTAIAVSLEEAALPLVVSGPNIADLLKKLTEMPNGMDKQDDAHEEARRATQLALQQATADAQACAHLSPQLQCMAAEALLKAQTAAEAVPPHKAAAKISTSALSATELDQKRANAVLAMETWEARAATKAQSLAAETARAVADITDAEQALARQRLHLVETQSGHALAWEHECQRQKETREASILELAELCKAKAPLASESEAMRVMRRELADLKGKIDLQARQMQTAEDTHAGVLKQLADVRGMQATQQQTQAPVAQCLQAGGSGPVVSSSVGKDSLDTSGAGGARSRSRSAARKLKEKEGLTSTVTQQPWLH